MRRKSKPRVIGRGKARKAQWAKGLEALALTAKLEERFGVSHEVQCARCLPDRLCRAAGDDLRQLPDRRRARGHSSGSRGARASRQQGPVVSGPPDAAAEIRRIKAEIALARDNLRAADDAEERADWRAEIESLKDELESAQEELADQDES
jgi:hypothetical protein